MTKLKKVNLSNSEIRRFQLIRIQFIEAMLIEHGFVTRKILVAALGLEAAMSSRDLALYATLNDTVYLNHTTKRWEATGDFTPVSGLLHVGAKDFLTAAGVVFGFELGATPREKTELGVIR
ncbi:hypothetical protein [Klebsiella pneumoniae]|uniref:hypothetical protein n=1 Tax=Klebsiella pneumoniae TaxID=573 RepID=UPI003D22F82D